MDEYTKMKLNEVKKGRLVYMIGLPRSGKSTFVNKWVQTMPGRTIVNGDSIRLALHGEGFIKEREKEVYDIGLVMVKSLLLNGLDVLVDETNTTPDERKVWQDMGGVGIFVDTPLDKCIDRVKGTGSSIEAFKDVIKNVYHVNLIKYPPVWEKDFVQYIGG